MLMGAVFILCVSVQPSLGLVYTGGRGHTTAPAADPGWDSVATMSIGSGTYLGDGWVLAPYHVYQSNPTGGRWADLDQRYYEVPGTARRIENNPYTDADLMMFRIEGNPDLPMVEISSAAPLGREATVIATGCSRTGDLVDFGGGYTGFQTTSARAKRWGRNVTGEYTMLLGSGSGRTYAFSTVFDSPGLGDDEAQLVDHDSGGSLFVESSSGDSWELGGMALSVGVPINYSGPGITTNAVYGNYSYYANLANYRAQIEEIRLTPLPGDADWDGDVDDIDIQIFDLSLGLTGPDLQADFNHDDVVDSKDLDLLNAYFGMVSGDGVPGAEDLPIKVVEPTTIVILTGVVPLLLRSRKRSPLRRGR